MFDNDTLEKCLEQISTRIGEEVRNINCGGCGVFAIELVKRLEKIGVKDAKIRCYGGSSNVNVAEVEANFNGNFPVRSQPWSENGIYFHHIRVEWNGKVYDGGSIDSNTNDWRWCNLLAGSISRQALEPLVKFKANWNSYFKRYGNMSKIRGIMDAIFREHGFAV